MPLGEGGNEENEAAEILLLATEAPKRVKADKKMSTPSSVLSPRFEAAPRASSRGSGQSWEESVGASPAEELSSPMSPEGGAGQSWELRQRRRALRALRKHLSQQVLCLMVVLWVIFFELKPLVSSLFTLC